jgi:small GTP-binding protein
VNKSGTELVMKIVVFGRTKCGKTSLLNRFTNKTVENYHDKTVKLFGETCIFYLWDTVGPDCYCTRSTYFYRYTCGGLLCFAINDRHTFEYIFQKDGLLEFCREYLKGIPILVGCKKDLENERKVSKEEAESAARENGMKYIETSAKTGENVEKAFMILGEMIYKKHKQWNSEPISSSKTNQSSKESVNAQPSKTM